MHATILLGRTQQKIIGYPIASLGKAAILIASHARHRGGILRESEEGGGHATHGAELWRLR